MANIYISLSTGGQADRARALIDTLRGEHDLTVYSSGSAYERLRRALFSTDVRVREIPNIASTETDGSAVDRWRSRLAVLWSATHSRSDAFRLAARLEQECADLLITDGEPVVSRAARRAGVPVVELDDRAVVTYGDIHRN